MGSIANVVVFERSMEVLLLTDIAGVGRKNDLIVVSSGYALNHLLPSRKAIVATPNVRKQYAHKITSRAKEREAEKELQMSLSSALAGKTVHIESKTAKGGKLYAQITPETISETLKSEYGVEIPASAISVKEHIKTVGTHTVSVTIGAQTTNVTVEVKASAEKAAK